MIGHSNKKLIDATEHFLFLSRFKRHAVLKTGSPGAVNPGGRAQHIFGIFTRCVSGQRQMA
jgi:hypothetical protein